VLRSSPPAAIWSDKQNTWPAWTWEGRVPSRLPVSAASMVLWTCDAKLHTEIWDHLLKTAHPEGEELLAKYFDGGVSDLFEHLREAQL